MGKEARLKKVVIVADWDADGVVSAAEIYYSQKYREAFPHRGKALVEMEPSGPRGFQEKAGSLGCGDIVVILDIPYTEEVKAGLKTYLESCGEKIESMLYFDHHDSTLKRSRELEAEFGILLFYGVMPTSLIVRNTLEAAGIRLTPRLNNFVKGVAVLEGGGKAIGGFVSKSIVNLTASISKTLNRRRDPDVWRRYVEWLANPLPFEPTKLPGSGETIVEASLEESREADEEVRRVATDLAMSSVKVGIVSFVDARGKWRRPGASALASFIHKIVKTPVALLFERDDGVRVLVLRSSAGEAKMLAKELEELGLVEDLGGHENVATARLREDTTIERLTKGLRRASVSIVVKRNRG
ncbi:hypothetical protein [Aeropyrum camini]|uniref:Phosphoesterase n=1 Tax=Aeropyrum camini SY1 = JCM 12091 TaxID=1198449 RepID=U3TFM6_9CREN|nr:hypothetical protein [Aeropyrum camini]BAN90845.1 hypothetical protein ACAM_1376 [Aeropyrum camini SY1 = JCM 12091]